MNIPPDLKEELLKVLKKLPESLQQEEKAEDMAHASVDQLQSLLPEKHEYEDGINPLDKVARVLDPHPDVVGYGKAIVHAQNHLERMSEQATKMQPMRFISFFKRSLRERSKRRSKMLNMAVTQLTVLRIKRDIMEYYEIDERSFEAKKKGEKSDGRE
jgi:hypothetical protein